MGLRLNGNRFLRNATPTRHIRYCHDPDGQRQQRDAICGGARCRNDGRRDFPKSPMRTIPESASICTPIMECSLNVQTRVITPSPSFYFASVDPAALGAVSD